eukprot:5536303-Amphidinium_carterae.1
MDLIWYLRSYNYNFRCFWSSNCEYSGSEGTFLLARLNAGRRDKPLQAVELLLEHRVDVNGTDSNGMTALMVPAPLQIVPRAFKEQVYTSNP